MFVIVGRVRKNSLPGKLSEHSGIVFENDRANADPAIFGLGT